MPAPLRGRAAAVVAFSGMAELLGMRLLIVPRTRHLGAWCTAALFVAVFPANVQMALDSGFPRWSAWTGRAVLAWLRLPLQAPLVLWALSLRRVPAAGMKSGVATTD